MNRLTCEMCGGSDLIKQDGVFICQYCGAKYSVEEAKKIMIEGNVDVSGSTVKVDASEELANLYQLARRARDDNNSENAAKYYDMILIKDPTSWEAAFYAVYFKAMECKIAEIRSAAISVSNCEGLVLELIRDHVPENEQSAAVREILNRSTSIAKLLSKAAKKHYSGLSTDMKENYTEEYINSVCAVRDILYTCGNEIECFFKKREDVVVLAVKAWQSGIYIHEDILSLLPAWKRESEESGIILRYREKMGRYDPILKKEYECLRMKDTIENAKHSINSIESDKGTSNFGIFFVAFAVIGMLIIKCVYDEWPIFLVLLNIFLIILGGWMAIDGRIKYKNNQEKLNREKERLSSLEDKLKVLEAEYEAAKKEQKK